jgi:acetyl-CoA carboxylase/biotin carboxylase 1
MAAKGCAQPAVWKKARRHFYWALRARLARNAALAAIAEASPESLPAYRARLLESLLPSDIDQNDKQKLAEALETLDLTTTLNSVRHAEITHKIVELAQNHRKATLEGMLRVIDTLTDEEKATITGALHASSGGGELARWFV